ncbi:methyl-accepting chemotaxis protein [Fictibacillus gelatini]|uniref:methyl-accepting chemotaxis protein n=1 Tax=Fictibacillus gelatini TaxID=225985 RepID=UPI0004243657|nr:methyl-accepting chemotaxis protein [Fictibacillus gelatini]
MKRSKGNIGKPKKESSIAKPIIGFTSLTLILLMVINGFLLYKTVFTSTDRTLGNFGTIVADSFSKQLDPALYEEFLQNKTENDAYWKLRDELNEFRKKIGAFYVYTIEVKDNQKLSILVDGMDKNAKNASKIGAPTTATTYNDVKDVLNGKTASTNIVHDAEYGDYLSAFAPIKNSSGDVIGVLGIDIKAKDAASISMNILKEESFVLVIVNIVTLLLSVGLIYFYCRRTLKPLTHLEEQAAKIAEGDFRLEELSYTKHNEVGRIYESFNNMKVQLNKLILDVKETAKQTNEQFSVIADEIRGIQEQALSIRTASEEIASGNEGVASSMENTSSVINGFQKEVQTVYEAVGKMEEITNDVSYTQQKSFESLQGLITASEDTREKFADVTKAMDRLNKHSEQIGNIVKEIHSIAGQTNLLALNASIEAARAGEHGKGFAVVANEVGNLANQSSEATKSIEKNIAEIQTHIVETITKTEETVHQFNEQYREMEEVKQSVLHLTELVEESKKSIVTIFNLISMMKEQQMKINEEVMSVTAVSEETAATTEEVTATIQQVESNVHHFAENVERVSKAIHNLETKTNQFKL